MDFSYQLYSARNAGPLDETLGHLKGLGYSQVEGWGGLYTDPGAIAQSLRRHGLTMPTGHFGIQALKDTAAALQTAKAIGIETLFCPAIPVEDRSPDSAKWEQLGQTLATIGADLKREGVGFGWHNHDFEFRKTTDGRFPMDIILQSAPDIEWEMDLAWVVKGGEDPLLWMEKYGSRITAIHVKDIAPAGEAMDEDGWADVGHGTLDWASLIREAQSRTRARHFVMEHDKPSDAVRFARRSIETARSWK